MSLAPDEMQELFTETLGEHVEGSQIQWDQLTVTLDAEGYVEAARLARDHARLACDFFDCISGVDEREDGFSVVTILYSTEHHHRVLLKHRCEGGRDNPVAPSLTDLYRGADWHEREAWDMFGIEFEGHPGLAPRILTTENFEGWPLRKDFYLATREAKPWPGIKEPQELDDEGNVIDRELTAEPGAAPGPMELDEAMAEQAKRAAGLLDEQPAQIEVEGETADVDVEAPRTTASDEGVGAAPDEESSARAERARRKAREMREEKRREREAAEAAGEEEKVEEPAGDADAPATAQDPRVSSPEERGEDTSEAAQRAKEEPDTYAPGEETRSERAERAVEEGQREAPDAVVETGQGGPPGVVAADEQEPEPGTLPEDEGSRGTKTGEGPGTQPAQAGDEPAPGAEAGEPPSAQEPGEAPVEGGLQESADEAADAGAGPSGGERPGSDEATETDQEPMPDDAADRSRTLPEDDTSSSSDSGRTPDDTSSSSDSGRTPDDEGDEA